MHFRFPMVYRAGLVLCVSIALAAWAQDAAENNNRGIAAYNSGQFADAIVLFEKAYDGAPGNPTVRRNLCNARQAEANRLAKQDSFAQAVKHLELAIGADPENPSPLVQLGSYYLHLGMVQESILRLEEAIELKPGELDAHELLGEAYYRDNDLSSARAQWDYVLEMDPNRKGLRERYDKAFREESVEYNFNRMLSGSRHFSLTFPKQVSFGIRSRVLTTLERAYIDIGRKLGSAYPPGPIQVILYDNHQFSEATQLDAHVGAVYDGKIRVPLTDGNGEALPDDELKRRIVHEYVHVVVRHILKDRVSWWLNEGLAEMFSREMDAPTRDLVRAAYAENRAFSLADLEGHQLKKLSPEALRLAYAQSCAATNLLWTRFGPRKMMEMLSLLGSGVSQEEALRQVYRRTYSTLDRDVASSLR